MIPTKLITFFNNISILRPDDLSKKLFEKNLMKFACQQSVPFQIVFKHSYDLEELSKQELDFEQHSLKQLFFKDELHISQRNQWTQDKSIQKLLESLASFLQTAINEKETYFISIEPDDFYWIEETLLYFPQERKLKTFIQEDDFHLSSYEAGKMHPILRKKEIPSSEQHKKDLTNYAFCYFLFCLFTGAPKAKNLASFKFLVDRSRTLNPLLSPENALFFRETLLSYQFPDKVEGLFQRFQRIQVSGQESLKRSFFQGEWSVDAYSAIGLNKKKSSNEDSFYSKVFKNNCLAFVADGVSTSDIGSGRYASSQIQNQLELWSPSLSQKTLDSSWLEQFQKLPNVSDQNSLWRSESVKFIEQFFVETHQHIVQEINKLYKNSNEKAKGNSHPYTMSSTLVLALCNQNFITIGYWGDSRAYKVTQSGSLIRLTEDHNEGMLQILDSVKKQTLFNFQEESSSALTRTVGACQWSEKDQHFVAVPKEKMPIKFYSFSIEEGEKILLCSDGLHSSISAESELKKDQIVGQILKKYEGQSLRKQAYELIQYADRDLGNDNITALLMKYSTPKKQLEQK